MKINITGKNIEITSAINDYVLKKLEGVDKFLGYEKNNDDVILKVELERTTAHHKEGEIFKAEINLHVHGENISVNAEQEDLYQAIDVVKDEVKRVLEDRKGKRQSLLRRGGRKIKDFVRGFYKKGE